MPNAPVILARTTLSRLIGAFMILRERGELQKPQDALADLCVFMPK